MISVSGRHIEYDGTCGLYVSATYVRRSALALQRIVNSLGIKKSPDFHTTLLYSRKAAEVPAQDIIDLCAKMNRRGHGAVVQATGIEVFKGHDDCHYMALTLEAPLFYVFHNQLLATGAQHNFTDYKPHITITKSEEPISSEVYHEVSQRLAANPVNLYFRVSTPSNLDM